METTMNNLHPDTSVPVDEAPQPNAAARPARLGDDLVRWAEFRLAMWMGAFAVAVIISSQGFMYSAVLGLKDDIGYLGAEMQRQNGELRAEMQKQNGELRAEMQRQNGELRTEMQRLNGELRVDMQTQIDDLRLDMQTEFGELRVEMQELRGEMQTQFGEQRERTVRIETHLGMDAGSVEKAN